jgi:hypothetical protein
MSGSRITEKNEPDGREDSIKEAKIGHDGLLLVFFSLTDKWTLRTKIIARIN